jgi:ABC-type uncharacterized transport system YnjBCD permease subunit
MHSSLTLLLELQKINQRPVLKEARQTKSTMDAPVHCPDSPLLFGENETPLHKTNTSYGMPLRCHVMSCLPTIHLHLGWPWPEERHLGDIAFVR